VSLGRLLLRQLDDFEAQPIPGIENGQGVNSPVFSPDGRSIAFYSSTEGVVRRVALGGGASVPVCPAEAPFGISWGSAGILVSQGAKGVLRCDLDGRAPETIFQPGEGEEAYGPQLLPDGKTRAAFGITGSSQFSVSENGNPGIPTRPGPSRGA
jgi:Tol biopolymer transport system component